MGTWGSGNFDSDTAADHLSDLTGRLVSEITEAMAGDPVQLEPDEYWGVALPCNLELLHTIAARGYVGAEVPDAEVIEGWKKTFMAVWEATIDDLGPSPAYKEERRGVLNRTFDQLADVARERAETIVE
ncbi:DUF4259 domain-containing protein [Streptomyces sp. NPDC091292]|uniref:DUF4259 domain-containing protein n=1 Tax=Streptomyces sp. NPDC091292 TaxID=3365991 RepID=UPI00380086F6